MTCPAATCQGLTDTTICTMFSKFALGLALIVASAFAEEGEKDDVGTVIGVDLGTT